ncbi:uncharacterized protein A4U43_C01F24640 [Asparagus officinalis]|uniref:Uncharacterized protein n=1 Tax=Asparagus officinalis TaxID=4686 RepID=A0A5P1FRU7_ASPOF|nr:uncharacterized protein A4U43_C01F24640 [Asparagus officinalis]
MLFRTLHAAPPSYILWNLAAMISCNPQTGRHLLHLQIISKLLTGSTFDQVGIISEVASIIREFTKPLANHGLYLVEAERVSRHPVLLVAAADSSEGLQPPVRRCVSHEIAMSPLIEAQRADMLSSSLEGVSKLQHEDISFESSKLDLIRPCYEATLGVYSLEDELIIEVQCRAMPGSSSSIKMQCSSEVEKHLSAGTMI